MQSFFEYLGASLGAGVDPDARYQDPDLRPAREPLEVGDDMVAKVAAVIAGAGPAAALSRSPAAIGDFLGRFLTHPKPRQRFAAPARPLAQEDFARALRRRGGQAGRLTLALPTRGLVRRGRIFLNGEAHAPGRAMVRLFKQLVSERSVALPIAGARVDDRALALLHGWYAAGYVRIG